MLENPENRRLLTAALAERYRVSCEMDGTHPDGPFDLCVTDVPSLRRRHAYLAQVRRMHDPLYLPVLLLIERRELGRLPPSITEVVDDLLLRPVERFELAARVQSLLRIRGTSLRARRLAGLYEQELQIARRLQSAALPNEFPLAPELVFDGLYHPADQHSAIGGDWYDVMRIADGRVVIIIGDVVGSGLEAAVTMSKLRQVVRGVAHVHPDPALMLEAADRTLTADEPGRYATVFVGVLDVIADVLYYASAGHTPPLLRTATGEVSELRDGGLLLGTGIRERRATYVTRLPYDASLLLYTDGLTEATRDIAAGEAVLRRVLAASPPTAQALYDAVITGETTDDIAVLIVRRERSAGSTMLLRRTLDSGDVATARAAQAAITERLRVHGSDEATINAAEVIFAELLGNCVRYAPGPVEVAIDTSRPAPVLHVVDSGPGFRHMPRLPLDLTSEGGRGLFIVRELAEEFSVQRASGGGSHARVVL